MSRKNQRKKSDDDLPDFKDGRKFDVLSGADKEKVWKYYERHRSIPLAQTRVLTAAERKTFERIRRKAGSH